MNVIAQSQLLLIERTEQLKKIYRQDAAHFLFKYENPKTKDVPQEVTSIADLLLKPNGLHSINDKEYTSYQLAYQLVLNLKEQGYCVNGFLGYIETNFGIKQ